MTRYLKTILLASLVTTTGCAQSGGGSGGGGISASNPPAKADPPVERSAVIRPATAPNRPLRVQGPQRETVRVVSDADRTPTVTSFNYPPKTKSTSEQTDTEFVHTAAVLHKTAIELGQVAQFSAGSADVRRFGQQMINDHSAALHELRAVCDRRGMKLSEDFDALHQNLITRLSRLNGANFDREYLKAMSEECEKDIAKYVDHSEGGYDPELRSYAAKTLPTLREDWRLAREIRPTTDQLR